MTDSRLLFGCFILSLCLLFQIIYFFLDKENYFPIKTIKITSNYEHISRKQLQEILSSELEVSNFFSIRLQKLTKELKKINWIDSVKIKRIWPDSLHLIITEKTPIAKWGDGSITKDGEILPKVDERLVELIGSEQNKMEILQIHQKLSKLLAIYGLRAMKLQLEDNGAWELELDNGIHLYLGRDDLESRLQRFCKVYLSVFAKKLDQIISVDLRYAHGMAVKWKQNMGI